MDFSNAPRQQPNEGQETGTPFKEVAVSLLQHVRPFLRAMFPEGEVRGSEYVVGNLGGEKGKSLNVNLPTGVWKDFASGEGGGDLISLIAARDECPQHVARRLCETWLAEQPAVNLPAAADTDPQWYRDVRADHRWEYQDEAGRPICYVYRFTHPVTGKKAIRPWSPETGRYEWPKLNVRPLFNLPEILTTHGPVVVVAGEKCADAISALGYTATTAMGGESTVAKADLSPLQDRDVLLWRDNDEAGAEWERKMMDRLKEACTKSIRLVKIPQGAVPKWDAADAPEEQRKRLIEEALKSQAAFGEITALRPSEFVPGKAPAMKWLTLGGIPAGKVSVIHGPSGFGKSFTMLDLGLKVGIRHTLGTVNPKTFLGDVPIEAAGSALFVTLEDDKDDIHRRLDAIDPTGEIRAHSKCEIITGPDYPGFNPILMRHDGKQHELTRFATHNLPRLIEKTAEQNSAPFRLLILDPAPDFLQGNVNDPEVVRRFISLLEGYTQRYECAVVMIGHGNKSTGNTAQTTMMGSGVWLTKPRFAIGIYPPKHVEAVQFLRRIGKEPSSKNIARVSFARVGKSASTSSLYGTRELFQNENTGVIEDHTDTTTMTQKRLYSFDWLEHAIRLAAEAQQPFTTRGANGLAGDRRDQLPAPLRNVGRNRLVEMVEELIDANRVVKCSYRGKNLNYLDVPNGPFTEEDAIWREGSWPPNIYDDLYRENDN